MLAGTLYIAFGEELLAERHAAKEFIFEFNAFVGDNTVIGSGSVVTTDIPANVVVVGNPCRVKYKILKKIKVISWRCYDE